MGNGYDALKYAGAGMGLALGLLATGPVTAKETKAPLSKFRKYFWGARDAYEQRDFKKAEQLLQKYRQAGSPSDPLLKSAGCDPTWEVGLFTTALNEARACFKQRPQSPYWTDGERAKLEVLLALRAGDVRPLEPYIDCAPADLVTQSTSCGAHPYRKPADLERLADALAKVPEIMKNPNWREFPIKENDAPRVRWVLYTYSEKWKPCGMSGSPIVSLRQDSSGQVRIAGFAASCLEPKP